MKNLFFLFLIFSLSFLQSTFLPLNLILLLVISLAIYLPARRGLIAAFGLGLWVDLLNSSSIGLTSLLFLTIVLLINLYRSRFHPDQLRFLLSFTFLALILINLVDGQVIEWGKILINTGMIVVFLSSVRLSFPRRPALPLGRRESRLVL